MPDADAKVDVVVIGDSESMCKGCKQALEGGGWGVGVAADGDEGLQVVKKTRPRVVLLDLDGSGTPGTDVLAGLSRTDPSPVVVAVTGRGTVEAAVECMRLGAFDVLAKPVAQARLLDAVGRGMKLSEVRGITAAGGKAGTRGKYDVLLEGLEVLSQSYALGLERQDFLEELRHLEAEARYHAESLGQVKKREKAILDIVHDFKVVDDVVEKHGYRKDALIQILLDIQGRLNWLPGHALRWLAARLGVPVADVCTITSFYEAMSLTPRGRHLVEVCLGTACHVRGGPELLTKVSALLGIKAGGTDLRGNFTLKTVHCLGCCALAPVVKIDGDYHSNPTMDHLKKTFAELSKEETVTCQN